MYKEIVDKDFNWDNFSVEEQNMILAYDAENNKFLGQGTTEDELESIIKQRFPHNIFLMNQRIFSAIEGIDVRHETTKPR